jgi:Imidazolonepropionase and related amidohydrolases
MTAFLLMATTIAFRGVTVIDGTGAPPKTDMLVVVSDDRIREISPVNRESLARLPAGAEVFHTDAKEAVAGGATTLAHGVLDPFDAGTIALMKSRPVFYIPTMGIFEFLADTRRFVDGVLSDPRTVAGLPAETVKTYRAAAYSDGYRVRYPNFANVRRHLPALRENLRRLHAAGVPIALGTDMWAFPGLGVSIELDLYVQAGLSPLEAIRAATQTAARSLGVEKDRGTLEPGKRADLVLLDADLLSDVKNVRAIAAVYKAGEHVDFK